MGHMSTQATILVTGINGFVGPHLARELHGRDCTIIGLGYGDATPELSETVAQYIACDLTDEAAVAKLDLASIDAVIHLAGLSSQGMSFEQPGRFIASNSAMLINLFEQALKQKTNKLPRFVVVSSGAIYDPEQPMPLTEDSKILGTSPYAISKILNENLCDYYRKRGFECVVARPFNHTGPGQGPGFLIPDLTRNILAAGSNGTVPVGNLKSRRDYSDARDVVRAYAELALSPTVPHTLYNISSGQSRSGEEVFALISQAAFGKDAAPKPTIDQSKIRPYEPADILTSNERLKADFDWQPTIPLEQTIQDYVAWCKEQTPPTSS
jgi:GDP-4-dehydro-6-deoxy-D-mannose reductase